MIMRGEAFTIPIGEAEAKALATQGWGWSSHMHPDGKYAHDLMVI